MAFKVACIFQLPGGGKSQFDPNLLLKSSIDFYSCTLRIVHNLKFDQGFQNMFR